MMASGRPIWWLVNTPKGSPFQLGRKSSPAFQLGRFIYKRANVDVMEVVCDGGGCVRDGCVRDGCDRGCCGLRISPETPVTI